MFKRHVFTCPDVIYLRNRQRKIALATNGVALLLFGCAWVYGTVLEKRLDEELEELSTQS